MFRSIHLPIVSLCGRSVYGRCVTYLESSIAEIPIPTQDRCLADLKWCDRTTRLEP
ncbi:hypothetical protein [Microcoleus sp. EPA2]|uniref:hypothetical protein n=1 Tax=Microcoleus sp. EPA2 TaxID=2841654 RepID=UPI00312B6108